jgi:hypothetical protein
MNIMPNNLLVEYQEFLNNTPDKNSSVWISDADGDKAYEAINEEMRESRQEFAKLEKESQRVTSEILINV